MQLYPFNSKIASISTAILPGSEPMPTVLWCHAGVISPDLAPEFAATVDHGRMLLLESGDGIDHAERFDDSLHAIEAAEPRRGSVVRMVRPTWRAA